MKSLFSEKVFELTKSIPKGRISTYKIIAERLNSKAYRAVGQVLKSNQYPIKVPCHRVIKSDCRIGGYSGNKNKKIIEKVKLLGSEGIEIKKNSEDQYYIENKSKYIFRF